MFLPEGGSKQQSGVSQITPANPQVTDEDIALMERVFSAAAARPNAVPETFMAYVLDFIQTNNLILPIGQIFGFSQFTAQASTSITVSETSSATAYGNLSTDGPTLSSLPDGQYVVFVTAWAASSNATYAAYTSVSVNGAAPSDNDAAISDTQTFQSVQGVSLQTLSNLGDNSLKMQYKVANGAATGSWSNRRILALKFSN